MRNNDLGVMRFTIFPHNRRLVSAAFAVLFGLLTAQNAFAGSCLLPAPQGCSGITPDTQARCVELGGVYYTGFDCAGSPASPPPTTAPPPATDIIGLPVEPITPRLQIPIPGLPKLSDVTVLTEDGRKVADIPFLAEYLAGLYRFLVGLAGLAATVMIIIGGMRWLLAAGDAGKIGAAKETITSATVGLTIALGSYIILFVLNPELVSFKSLRITLIPPIPYEMGGYNETDETLNALTNDKMANTRSVGAYCPESGGAAEIPKIIESLKSKVAYRWGGKGGPPPYHELEGYEEFENFCPAGNICLDCSGFTTLVYKCMGLPYPEVEMINPETSDLSKNIVNGVVLKPGDLLGWRGEDIGKPGSGHVIMYIGDGKIAEAAGGKNGRQPNANPLIRPLNRLGTGYKFTRIRRIRE